MHFIVYPACAGNSPDVGLDTMCPGIDIGCPPGSFWVWVFAAPATVAVATAGWTRVGERCSAPADTGSGAVVGLGLQDFQRLPLPAGSFNVEPPGGYVLVSMPTNVFASSTEPVVLTATVLGQSVQVRATPARWSWDFGDGTVLGPTSDPGAAYPALINTHAYAERGDYDIVMTTHYTGEFSLDGAAWYPIQGEARVDSEPVTVTAMAGRNVLVAEPQP